MIRDSSRPRPGDRCRSRLFPGYRNFTRFFGLEIPGYGAGVERHTLSYEFDLDSVLATTPTECAPRYDFMREFSQSNREI
jgi:hypothetical protein